jgi:hypothetical protein
LSATRNSSVDGVVGSVRVSLAAIGQRERTAMPNDASSASKPAAKSCS